jgi:hypothetical protein
MSFPRQSYCHAVLTSPQTITHDTWTTIIFDSKVDDILGEYNNSTGVFTAKEDGVYVISYSARWNTSFVALVQFKIWADGAAYSDLYRSVQTPNRTYSQTFTKSVSSGNTIYIQARQNSGSNKSLIQFGTTRLSIVKVA